MKFDKLTEAYMNVSKNAKPKKDFSNVQRYEGSHSPGDSTEPDENGSWVSFSDYAELLNAYNEAKEEIKKLNAFFKG